MNVFGGSKRASLGQIGGSQSVGARDARGRQQTKRQAKNALKFRRRAREMGLTE